MISEQDKQAILNGAYGVTRDGELKAKFLGRNMSRDFMWCFYDIDGDVYGIQCFSCGFYNGKFQQSDLDIVGLWQDKPEPFNLECALQGKPVVLRNGSKAVILAQVKDTLIGYFDDASPLSWELDGSHDRAVDSSHDITGMWKEPEPQLSSNSLQLPKPITSFKDNDAIVYMLSAVPFTGKFKVEEVKTFNRDESMLANGRYYNSKQDVIQVIEAITGKPYEDRYF